MKKFTPFDKLGVEPPHAGEGEAAFRRGYQQGAFYVLQAIKEGVTPSVIEKFIEGELREWRDRPNDPAFPPEIER